MLDIAKEREFIQAVDQKTRRLELEKAKLEQSKASTEQQMSQVVAKMTALGCTPEDIDTKIQEHAGKITALKSKMQEILGDKEEAVANNDFAF